MPIGEPDVIDKLAMDYQGDLSFLSNFALEMSVVSQEDRDRLSILCSKHNLDLRSKKLDLEKNIPSIVGQLSGKILDKLETLAVEYVLEKRREVDAGSIPKKSLINVEQIPDKEFEGGGS